MLCLPYLTPAGVVKLKFRCMCGDCKIEGHPKYNGPTGAARLYNVSALHSEGATVAISEGEIDALVASALVGIPTVGCPGGTTWQPHWTRAFADYDRIIIFADDDEAGHKHAQKLRKEFEGRSRIVTAPGGDINSWYLSAGADAIRKAAGV